MKPNKIESQVLTDLAKDFHRDWNLINIEKVDSDYELYHTNRERQAMIEKMGYYLNWLSPEKLGIYRRNTHKLIIEV